jgi:hypothetical protein
LSSGAALLSEVARIVKIGEAPAKTDVFQKTFCPAEESSPLDVRIFRPIAHQPWHRDSASMVNPTRREKPPRPRSALGRAPLTLSARPSMKAPFSAAIA